MLHQRRLSAGMRWLLGSLTIAACLIGVGNGLRCLMSEPFDPQFICGYPGYGRLHEGMSAVAVKRILGEPTSKSLNSEARVLNQDTITRLQAEERRLAKEDDNLDKALYETGSRPTGLQKNQLKQSLERCRKQREQVSRALSMLVKEVWYYNVRGWDGHIEVYIDVFGKVRTIGCGHA